MNRSLLVVILAVIIYFNYNLMIRFGVFNQITNSSQYKNCKVISEIVGSEDLEIDHKSGIAYISSAPLVPRNFGAKPAIYKLDLSTGKFEKMILKNYPNKDLHLPHGISLYRDGEDLLIFVINHGETKDNVEVFKIKNNELHFITSTSHELLMNINDVKSISPTEFYTTSDHGISRRDHPILSMLEDILGLQISYITYCNIKTQQCRKVIEGFGSPNGINYVPKTNMVYVAQTLGGYVYSYKLDKESRNLTFVESVFLDTGLDNIDVDENGLLWVASHPKVIDVFMYMFNNTQYSPFRAWKQNQIGALNFTLVYSNTGEQLSAGSTAAFYKGHFLVGSVASHVLHCTP